MERFAIKIDRKLKANLYKICRLCGMDYPDMVPILSDDKPENAKDDEGVDVDAEPEMSQKINVLIGLLITKDDRMPQTMCTLCVDKVNDFYEFREMCYATYEQTRKLLGLKNVVKKPVVEPKPKLEVKEEIPVVPPPASNKLLNRKRKAEIETAPAVVVAPPVVSNKKLRLAATPLKEAATKKAKLKAKEWKEAKEEEKEAVVKDECREVITRNMKLMKEKEAKEAKEAKIAKDAVKEETTNTAVKEESNEKATTTTSKKDHKEKYSKKEHKDNIKESAFALKKDNKEIICTKKGKHKAKEAKEEDVTAVKDEIKEEVKEEPMTAQTSTANSSNTAIANPTAKLKHGCSICSERFGTKGKLEAHVRLHHIPKVERYVCTACNETISKSFDIKNHQLWHKLSKTPYVCGLCGESIVSTYAYARHLHEHGFETPPAYMVLDRECPQCHITFTTNFLYNTHPCAVRTRRCAGCNRLQRSEIEYVKHSALCAKAYLNYSKHIAPAVEAQEDEVRIKNENDVEAAAEEMARISGLPLEMSPVVQLTRLSSPLLMAANHCLPIPNIEDIPTTSGSKKSGKKGVSKKELKRVDELLKSTLDVLVSIKHEPEVHVDSETAPGAAEASDDEAIGDDGFQNDFHHNEESDDENENAAAGDAGNRIQIKQEIDDSKDTAHATAESSENGASKTSCGFGLKLKIRKEHGQLNSSIIEQEAVDKKSEKRKKKKKHKDKEKDKQKSQKDHAEEQNSRDSFKAQNHVGESDGVAAVKETPSTTVHIKTEPVDSMETDEAPSAINSMTHRLQPEATIMTSIPMMQLQISCISEGVEFNAANVSGAGNVEQPTPQHQQPHNMSEQEDVKPNREELDRMLSISHMPPSGNEVMPPPATKLQIANVTGGIAMETDETKEEVDYETTMEQDHADATDDEHHEEEENEPDNQLHKKLHIKQQQQQKLMSPSEKLSKTKLTLKITSPKTSTPNKSRNKACKSTAKPSNPPVALQIAAVQSGVTLPPSTAALEPMEQNDFVPMFIKPEPQHRGYADEEPAAMPPERTPSPTPSPISSPAREVPEGVNTSSQHFTPEEQAYISTIDFDNITIKQEKDLDINDVQMKPKKPLRPRNHSLNGIKKRKVIKEHSVAENHNEDAEEKECEASSEMEDDEEHESEAEEADEEADEEEEEEEEEVDEEDDEEEDVDEDAEDEEEREYRELEYPPELAETATPDDGEETELSDNENNTDNERPSNIDEDDEDLDADENSQRSSDPKESPLQDESNKDDQYKKEGGEANDNKTPSAFVIANICSNVAEAATGIGVILEGPVVNIKQEITEFEEPPQESALVLKIASVASGSLDLGNILPIESGLAATLHQNSLAVEPQCHMETDQNMTEIHRPNQSLTENNMEDNSMVQMGTLNENVNIDAPPQEVRITHERHVQENTTNQYSNQTPSDITTSQFIPQLENPMEVPTNSIVVGVSNNNPYIPRLLEDTAVAINASNLNYPTCENPNTEVNGIASEMGGLVGESPVAAIPIPNQNENQILSHLANDESAVRKTLLPQGEFEDGTITGIVHQSDDLKLEAIPVNVTREQCNPSSSSSSSVALNQMGSPTEEDEYDETNAADGETDMDDEMQLEDNSNLANLEEQQNQQNLEQQLSSSSSQFAATATRPTALALHPYLEDISSSSNSFLSNALSQTPPPTLQTSSNCSLSAMETVATTTTMPPVSQNLNITHQQNNEETENILNESNDMLNRRCGVGFAASSSTASSSTSTHHTAAFNFDNINEIAENNNNANIEREQLQDDQQQQRRHQQQHQDMDDVT